jgi:hypothetical protein
MTETIHPTSSSVTVFSKLLEPLEDFIQAQNQALPRHPNQKYTYLDFFRLMVYFYVSGSTSLKLLIQTRLNSGLLPSALGLYPVPYTTCQDAFERFSPDLFRAAFQHLLAHLPFKAVPEFAALGCLCCIDGSLFPVIRSMSWADYTGTHQALKLHLCFELNRMIPTDFQIGSGNSSERQALIEMAVKGVTYIADRGYMSFQLACSLTQIQAHFIFRVKTNWVIGARESLPVSLPSHVQSLFQNVTDELIRYTHDPSQALYRLVCFSVGGECYHLLTDRQDLTTFQVILLYAYRWQIELMFRFLKRTLNGIHLIRHDQRGVSIQFYMILIVALLELSLKQSILDPADPVDSAEEVSQTSPIAKSDPNAKTPPSRLDGVEFVAALGRQMKIYWKIGIHWLTTLRDLLAFPFDDRSRQILLNSS